MILSSLGAVPWMKTSSGPTGISGETPKLREDAIIIKVNNKLRFMKPPSGADRTSFYGVCLRSTRSVVHFLRVPRNNYRALCPKALSFVP